MTIITKITIITIMTVKRTIIVTIIVIVVIKKKLISHKECANKIKQKLMKKIRQLKILERKRKM